MRGRISALAVQRPVPLLMALGAFVCALGMIYFVVIFNRAIASMPPAQQRQPEQALSPDPCTWTSITTIDPGSADNWLYGVSATSATDAWAVGAYSVNAVRQTLIEHWNGTAWSVVSSPNVGSSHNGLQGVVAFSAANAWAVGYNGSGAPLVLHWDGSSWSLYSTPLLTSGGLNAITAISPTDMWTVGTNGTHFLAAHYDGSSWTPVNMPDVGGYQNTLNSVAALSSNDVLAVGYYRQSSATFNQTLIEQWNGTTWSVVSSPNLGTRHNVLYGVAAIAANSYMAVGYYTGATYYQTLTISVVNGTASLVASPNVALDNTLYAVIQTTSGNAIAVGQGNNHSLVLNWNGSSWATDCSDDNLASGGQMNAISMVPGQFGAAVPADIYTELVVGIAKAGSTSQTHGWGVSTAAQTATPASTGTRAPTATRTLAVPTTTVVATNTQGPSATPTEYPDCTWLILKAFSDAQVIRPHGVLPDSEDDSVAVGVNNHNQAAISQFDGVTWTSRDFTLPQVDSSELNGVASDGQGNLFAVGDYTQGANITGMILEKLASSQNWLVQDTISDTLIMGLGFTTSNFGVAVGQHPSAGLIFASFWNGSNWTEQVIPTFHPYTYLHTTYAAAPNDVYVGGDWSIPGASYQFLAHWDGFTWTEITVPLPSSSFAVVDSISPDPNYPGDVFISGSYVDSGGIRVSFTLKGNASSGFTDVPITGVSGQSEVHSIVGSVQSGVHALGALTSTTGIVTPVDFLYDSQTNTFVPEQAPFVGNVSYFSAGGVIPGSGRIFAVGSYLDNGVQEAFSSEFGCGAPPPSPTFPVPFTDVHPSDYFYGPVGYLHAKGVLSGYADNTFRPYHDTTRGQMTKFVVLGDNLPIITPTPPAAEVNPSTAGYTFTDVQPGSTFYQYVETLYANGITSGYPCGGTGEPCDNQHRPYFRPGNNVTRGQLVKFTSLGNGWPLSNPATYSFEDVLPGSAFYQYVETAYCHTVISGYPCGGAGEPCDSQHRPYFRPGNSATRGQIAKIIYYSLAGQPHSCTP